MGNDRPDGFKVQTWVGNKYKPLIVRGRPLHTQARKSDFAERRRAGCQAIDIWLDSKLYPADPTTGKPPKIDSPSKLLEFVGDGENGLLGYVNKLESVSGATSSLVKEKEIEISVLRGRIDELIKRSAHESIGFQAEISRLTEELNSVQSGMSIMRSGYEEHILKLNSEISLREVLEKQYNESLRTMEVIQKEQLGGLVGKLQVANRDLEKAKSKLESLKKTPFGYRSQIRKRRDISTLAPNGGHAKAMRRLARMIGAPETTRGIQMENATGSTHKG